MTVPARLSVVTLGARDLPSLARFYDALGWPRGVDMDGFVAFGLRGAVLALFPLDELAADARSAVEAGSGAKSLAVNVDRREEVDAVLQAAAAAGATVLKPGEDAPWGGRSGYFTDPEGHLWEVAWVPPDSLMARLVATARGESAG